MKNIILHSGDETSFKLNDGREVRNLNELSEMLESMDDGTWMHHVNDEKNDFSTWVLHALSDEKLAKNLLGARDRREAQVTVLKRIIELLKEVAM
ncbi:MAG: DUF5752 family protein [archaeon]